MAIRVLKMDFPIFWGYDLGQSKMNCHLLVFTESFGVCGKDGGPSNTLLNAGHGKADSDTGSPAGVQVLNHIGL